jgi:nucleoside-diphosphate-sugar epimerase
LVDGGSARRSFTDVADAIAALMTIIKNPNGIASGKIYNIGNPANNHSVRELAEMLMKLAPDYPEYRAGVAKTKVLDTSAAEYYGEGYQDVQNRNPSIKNTMADLNWQPTVSMPEALRKILEIYRDEARTITAAQVA